MRKAFTLIEMVVALGILAVVLMFAGEIFRVSVNSQRLAVANGEIMQKLRVITSQLDADFRGMLTTYGGQLNTNVDSYGAPFVDVNSDSVAFFANGDYQTSRVYNTATGSQITIVGNVASIFYGSPDISSYTNKHLPMPNPKDRMLLRRQTILTPKLTDSLLVKGSNWQGEYCCMSLEDWRIAPPFTPGDWAKRPIIDPNSLDSYLPMYLVKGVDSFTISYLAQGASWQSGPVPWSRPTDRKSTSVTISPRAIRFEFTLYDSRGLIRGGRRFSHIVLLDR
jgi:prepilin-type N-terminal cleavage/methylation domain-containing protein